MQDFLIKIAIGLIAALITAWVSIRSLRQQKRLSYLQSILQVPANRVRLQSLLSSVRFLIAVNEMFPGLEITEKNIKRFGNNLGDLDNVLLVTIYARERLFSIRIRRRKHDEKMEDYEERLYGSSWIESWRSDSVVEEFKCMLLASNNSLYSGARDFQKFVNYVKKFIVWCILEPQFDMIFAISPKIRKKIQQCMAMSLRNDRYTGWLTIESEIYKFYQGKDW